VAGQGIEFAVFGQDAGGDAGKLVLKAVEVSFGLEPAAVGHFFDEKEKADFADETVEEADFGLFTRKAALLTAVLLVVTTTFYTTGIRSLYGDQPTGWGGHNLRFGPDADWRIKPILKSKPHA